MIALEPDPNETYEHFVIRAHRELMHRIPDPGERNEVVWEAWRQANGDAFEEQLSSKLFPDDRFVRRRNVCLFAEHDAVDGQGRPRHYDLASMVRCVRGNNHRIRDFDGFAPIADGHTPAPDDPDQTRPEILGYAGPYRLGMIGREDPRWAIFADEAHIREHADRLAVKPRRSVELWTFASDPKRMYFDPIAALGSETPRLPLPVQYSSDTSDATVYRYSMTAASDRPAESSEGVAYEADNEPVDYCNDGGALPGSGNTHVKAPLGKKKTGKGRYGAGKRMASAALASAGRGKGSAQILVDMAKAGIKRPAAYGTSTGGHDEFLSAIRKALGVVDVTQYSLAPFWEAFIVAQRYTHMHGV